MGFSPFFFGAFLPMAALSLGGKGRFTLFFKRFSPETHRTRALTLWLGRKLLDCNRQFVSLSNTIPFRVALPKWCKVCARRSLSPAITTRCFPRPAGLWCGSWSDWASILISTRSRPVADRCTPTPASAAEAFSQAKRFVHIYKDTETVVIPSSSCVAMMRDQYPQLFEELGNEELRKEFKALLPRVYELSEFLIDRLGVEDVGLLLPASGHLPCQLPWAARIAPGRPAVQAAGQCARDWTWRLLRILTAAADLAARFPSRTLKSPRP